MLYAPRCLDAEQGYASNIMQIKFFREVGGCEYEKLISDPQEGFYVIKTAQAWFVPSGDREVGQLFNLLMTRNVANTQLLFDLQQ